MNGRSGGKRQTFPFYAKNRNIFISSACTAYSLCLFTTFRFFYLQFNTLYRFHGTFFANTCSEILGYVREKSATFGRNRPWNSKSSNLTDTLEMCLNILHLSIRINITVEFNKRYWFLFAMIIYSLQAYEIFTYSIFIAIMNNNSRRQKRNWEQVFDVYFFPIFLHIPYFLLIQWNDTSFPLICFQFLFIFYKLSPSTIVVVGKDKMRFE